MCNQVRFSSDMRLFPRKFRMATSGATDAYGYNLRSEVVSSRRTLADSPIRGFDYDYAYDPIGNRTSATDYDEQGNALVSSYTANALNQYTQRTVPGYAAIRGEAATNATVTVNERPTFRQGAFFYGGDVADNTDSSVYKDLEVYAAINPPGTNTPDIVSASTGTVFIARTPESFTYDADGNMTSDGRFHYTWNAENRLVMASNDTIVVTYAYDHRGRMVRKDVARTDNSPFSILHYSFVWDDWNIIREVVREGDSVAVTDNIWGLDIDGTLQGAGGVGGLLAVVRDDGVFFPTYDANGNISEYVSESGEIVAHYDYSPFGEPLVASGPLASTFIHQFSTKPFCAVTGFNEYVYRKYRPDIGRWMSRDPLVENGISYAFSGNSQISKVDYLGLFVPRTRDVYSCDTTRFQTFDMHKKLPIRSKLNGVFDMNFSAEYKTCQKCCSEETAHPGKSVRDWEVDVGVNVRMSISGGTFYHHIDSSSFGGWWKGAKADVWGGIYAEGGLNGAGSFSGGSDRCNNREGTVGGCFEFGGYFQVSGGGQLAVHWHDAMFRYGVDITGKLLGKIRICVVCSSSGCQANGAEACLEGDVSFNAHLGFWSFTKTLFNGGRCFKL